MAIRKCTTIKAKGWRDNPPAISAVGLPPGLSLQDNGDGTGTVIGIVSDGASAGSPYSVTITANNGEEEVQTTFEWNVTV